MKEPCTDTAIILVNLGSPKAANTKAVRRYLAEFLSDPYVVQVPRLIWWCILNGIILPFYAKSSAAKYQRVWTAQGSPLINGTQQLANKLQHYLCETHQQHLTVCAAMRYGEPSIEQVLSQLKQQGIQRVIALPLYPQYARSTSASSLAKLEQANKTQSFELQLIEHYHQQQAYIDAISQSIEDSMQQNGKPEKLIFSFHGLPQKVVDKGDPYYQHCQATVAAITKKLNLNKDDGQLCFQSRFGPADWLQPYTVETIERLGKEGIKHIAVVCPGFAIDCLETLEEINILNRETFRNAGGERFDYIPALNDSENHVYALSDVLKVYLYNGCRKCSVVGFI